MPNETLAIVAMTYDQNNPDAVEQYTIAAMTDEWGDTIPPIRGKRAIDFCKQFDYVVHWHWPPESFIRTMEENGSKVIVSHAIAHIKQKPDWNRQKEALRVALFRDLDVRYVGNKNNTYGSPFVDIYERHTPPAPNAPHTYAIALNRTRAVRSYRQALQRVIRDYYPNNPPHDHFIDVANSEQWWGGTRGATNAVMLPPHMNWRPWLRMIQSEFGPVWGHTALLDDDELVADIRNRIVEWAFRDNNDPQLVTQVNEWPDRVVLCPNQGPDDIARLRNLRSWNLPFIEQRARTSFYAFDCELP